MWFLFFKRPSRGKIESRKKGWDATELVQVRDSRELGQERKGRSGWMEMNSEREVACLGIRCEWKEGGKIPRLVAWAPGRVVGGPMHGRGI